MGADQSPRQTVYTDPALQGRNPTPTLLPSGLARLPKPCRHSVILTQRHHLETCTHLDHAVVSVHLRVMLPRQRPRLCVQLLQLGRSHALQPLCVQLAAVDSSGPRLARRVLAHGRACRCPPRRLALSRCKRLHLLSRLACLCAFLCLQVQSTLRSGTHDLNGPRAGQLG